MNATQTVLVGNNRRPSRVKGAHHSSPIHNELELIAQGKESPEKITPPAPKMVRGKTQALNMRVDPNLKELIAEAAKLSGQKLTDFMLSNALKAARSVILESRAIRLSELDYDRFVAALCAEPKPISEELQKEIADFNSSIQEDGSCRW